MITVTSYNDLHFWIEMFRNGNADLVLLSGSAGIGKSEIVNEVMKDIESVRVLSHITPLALYLLGYEHQNKPFIFDDLDGLLTNAENISLLKQFCESTEVKQIGWFSTSKLLQDIPAKYETKSRCLMIVNNVMKANERIAPIIDRAWHIHFAPTVDELLAKMEYIKNTTNILPNEAKERVFQLIKKYAKVSENLSLRSYTKGCMLYKNCNGQDWEDKLLSELGVNPKMIVLDRLLTNLRTDKERLVRWENNGWSRRSFYEYKRIMVQKCSENPNMDIQKMPALMHN